jgi:hypothetical protein
MLVLLNPWSHSTWKMITCASSQEWDIAGGFGYRVLDGMVVFLGVAHAVASPFNGCDFGLAATYGGNF